MASPTDAARAACAFHRVAVCRPKRYAVHATQAQITWPNTPLVDLFPVIAGSIETFRGVCFLARKTLPTIHCLLLTIPLAVPFFS